MRKGSTAGMAKPQAGAAPQETQREPRSLSPAAQRALAEAAARREQADGLDAGRRPTEVNGRGGAEPVRFGDWEVKGLAVDF